MIEEATLSEALADVRKAYRFLWCYQERIIDIVRVIAGEFDDLKFYYSVSHTTTRRDAYNVDLLNNSWHAFPLMNVSYLYKPERGGDKIDSGEWLLEIRVISDTGCADDNAEAPGDATKFRGIEQTETRLNLYIFYCQETIKGNWLKTVWDNVLWPEPDGRSSQDADLPVATVGMSWDLAKLQDKDAAQTAVLDFKATASTALGLEFS
ncbi:MAG: hypothetical protein ACRED9_01620 [Caulobacteraceae bacterium]